MGRQHQEMDRTEVRQFPEGSGEQRKTEETACEVICGAPTISEVKEQVKTKKGREWHEVTVAQTTDPSERCPSALAQWTLDLMSVNWSLLSGH